MARFGSMSRRFIVEVQAEGLVGIPPKRGSFILTPNPKDVGDICEYRTVLEAAAVRLALAENRMPCRIPEGRGYFRADWKHPMPIIEISGEEDIFDAGRIMLFPLLGDSPGLVGLLASPPNTSQRGGVSSTRCGGSEHIYGIDGEFPKIERPHMRPART